MRRTHLHVWIVVLAVLVAVPVSSAKAPKQDREARKALAQHTKGLRAEVWHWQVLIGQPRSRTRLWIASREAHLFWHRRLTAVRRAARRPPNFSAWMCIHRYEGAWNDYGDPYWGGLQMDRSFMFAYATRWLLRRGFANRWTPLEQMWVAERAHRSGRGFYPWPNTARWCGLI